MKFQDAWLRRAADRLNLIEGIRSVGGWMRATVVANFEAALLRGFARGAHAVLVLDGTGWRSSARAASGPASQR